jgi:hypothetical protein
MNFGPNLLGQLILKILRQIMFKSTPTGKADLDVNRRSFHPQKACNIVAGW